MIKFLLIIGQKESQQQMEGHASLMYSIEEAKHHHTFPLELLQFTVSRGKSSLYFAYGKIQKFRNWNCKGHLSLHCRPKFNGQAHLNGF